MGAAWSDLPPLVPRKARPADATLYTACAVCDKTKELVCCALCQVQWYCSQEHQTEHWDGHKEVCNALCAYRDMPKRHLESLLGESIPPEEVVSKILEYGHDSVKGLGPYCMVRQLMTLMTVQASRDAVLQAVNCCNDIFRLDPSDEYNVRRLAPSFLIRLDQDRKAYGFVKWWATTDHTKDNDFSNADLLCLDNVDTDMFERVDVFIPEVATTNALSHMISVALLKIRLLFDLKSFLRAQCIIPDHVPQEIRDQIYSYGLHSIAGSRKEITALPPVGLEACCHRLARQVEDLLRAVHVSNSHMWTGMLEAGDHLASEPSKETPGTVDEMQRMLGQNYDAWIESHGAMEVIKAKLDYWGKDE